jgi:hypothetical protein
MAYIDRRIILAYVQILLDLVAIHFKFHDWINQRSISFQSAISETAQGDKHFCTSWQSVKLCRNRNKRPRSTQGAYFRSYARSVNQCVKISHGLPIDVLNQILYFLYAQCHIQISQGSPLTYLTISYTFFTITTPRIKSKGLLINVPLSFYYF